MSSRPSPTRRCSARNTSASASRPGCASSEAAPDSTPAAPVEAPSKVDKRKYRAILTEDELKDVLLKIEGVELVGVDAIATSEDPLAARLVGLAFAFRDEAVYLPLAHDYAGAPAQLPIDTALGLLKPWLERADCRKVGENVKFDAHVLANHGVRLAGCMHDTLLESYVLEVHERHELGMLAQRYCGWTVLGYDEVTGKGAGRIPFASVEVTRAAEYAAQRTDCALALHELLFTKIEGDEKLSFVYGSIEMPALPVLWRMERNGVLLDRQKLDAQSHELGKDILALEQKAYEAAGQPFNLGSPKQIQEILFDRLKLPVKKKTPSGQPSTDEDSLAELALDHPLPKLILEHRTLSKLKSTYTDKLPRSINPQTGRVHTTYSQTTAVTGRLSSNEPNLQNIPIRTPAGRRIRECFIAPPGAKIVSADYSQIELRIMAHLSGDENLRRAFREGEDVHRATAAEVFGLPLEQVGDDERRVAKVINFGLIYGMSSFGVAQNLGIDRGTAQTYVERYFARFPGAKRYMDETRKRAKEVGYVETVYGRRLWLPELRSGAPVRRQAAERAAINAPMQGTAADLIKLAMIAVQAFLEKERLKTLLDHAGARRAGARGTRGRAGNHHAAPARADAVGRQAGRPPGRGSRRRRQLGQGALASVRSGYARRATGGANLRKMSADESKDDRRPRRSAAHVDRHCGPRRGRVPDAGAARAGSKVQRPLRRSVLHRRSARQGSPAQLLGNLLRPVHAGNAEDGRRAPQVRAAWLRDGRRRGTAGRSGPRRAVRRQARAALQGGARSAPGEVAREFGNVRITPTSLPDRQERQGPAALRRRAGLDRDPQPRGARAALPRSPA